ncbi:hypothetical protein [Streptomyces luteogriseus]|uniref:hypothetical protein n=1 Tax=Streptomyces luteogriseus TaxID=68233 RepID=UPI00378E2FA9
MGTFGRRLLLAVDAKGYGGVDVVTQREWQEAIRRLLEDAARVAGLDWEQWVTQVGGDSVFAVLPQGASEPALVDPFMRQLESGLRMFNRNRRDEAWLRLRAAVHFGTASPAANGFEGRAPVEIGRLLDSRVLKAALAAAPEAHLALAVSATVFNDVIGEAYTTIRPQEFREVRVAEKEYAGRAWIRVPGYDMERLDLGVAGPGAEDGPGGAEAAAARPRSAPTAPGDTVVHVINGTVHAPGAVFGISK